MEIIQSELPASETHPVSEPGEIFRRIRERGLAPEALDPGAEWIERRAKLFESGDFPDKGLSVTPDLLRRLAEGFEGPVPVLIEHSDSPLELGFLIRVEALGDELVGPVALTREADALVERSGARSLSLGLSPDLGEIREVSLVRNPRIGSARLFSGDLVEAAGAGRQASGDGNASAAPSVEAAIDAARTSPPKPPPRFASQSGEGSVPRGTSEWRERFERLREEVDAREAERRVDSFMKEGRLCPAQVPFALALLMTSDTVEFGGDRKPLRELLIAMIERQPPMALFAEIAPDPGARGDHSAQLLMPEEAEFYRRHFPDVSLDEIARRR